LTATLTQTQPATAYIFSANSPLQFTRARIAVVEQKIQAALARLSQSHTENLAAESRITALTEQLETAVARITQSASQTISGQSRLSQQTTHTQIAVARVQTSLNRLLSALARIETTQTVNQSAVARVAQSKAQLLSALARLTQSATQTQTATAYVTNVPTATILALSRIETIAAHLQTSVASIAQRQTKTLSATSRLAQSHIATQTGTGAIQAGFVLRTQTGTARILVPAQPPQNLSEFRPYHPNRFEIAPWFSATTTTLLTPLVPDARVYTLFETTATAKPLYSGEVKIMADYELIAGTVLTLDFWVRDSQESLTTLPQPAFDVKVYTVNVRTGDLSASPIDEFVAYQVTEDEQPVPGLYRATVDTSLNNAYTGGTMFVAQAKLPVPAGGYVPVEKTFQLRAANKINVK
jgi:hypothetical protein